jgi:hypothetical protein
MVVLRNYQNYVGVTLKSKQLNTQAKIYTYEFNYIPTFTVIFNLLFCSG